MVQKNTPLSNTKLITRLVQEINLPLKTLSSSSQKLLDKYRQKNFEYISFKDFKQLLFTLEQMNKQLQRCYQSSVQITGLDNKKIHQETLNINSIINDILGLLKNQLSNSKIKTYVRLGKNVPLVKINNFDGHQIIQNILTNAMNAMPAGGKIKITTSHDVKSKGVTVEISDDGVGISQTRLVKIFEPFFTTKEQHVEKSSGLGLSIVYSILQASGGSIKINSSLRNGTQVQMFLPAMNV